MSNIIQTALGALTAQSLRIGAAADNIANLSTSNYQEKRVVLTSESATGQGGVSTQLAPAASLPAFTGSDTSPSAGTQNYLISVASGQGVRDTLVTSVLDIKEAEFAFKAAVSLINTVKEIDDSLLEVLA